MPIGERKTGTGSFCYHLGKDRAYIGKCPLEHSPPPPPPHYLLLISVLYFRKTILAQQLSDGCSVQKATNVTRRLYCYCPCLCPKFVQALSLGSLLPHVPTSMRHAVFDHNCRCMFIQSPSATAKLPKSRPHCVSGRNCCI